MKTNKPQWLIEAEAELAKFNESKIAKMTQGQFNRSRSSAQKNSVAKYVKQNPQHQKKAFAAVLAKNPNHQSKAGKIGGPKGAKVAHKILLEKYGEEGLSKLRKDKNYSAAINACPDFHTRGNNASIESRRKVLNELYMKIIADLPEVFTIPELKDILQKYGKQTGYIRYIMKHKPEYFEIIKVGIRGTSHAQYRVINR